MALITKSYTFSAGATILASEHNQNFDVLYNWANGNVDNANIKASAGISLSKLALGDNATFTGELTFANTVNFTSTVTGQQAGLTGNLNFIVDGGGAEISTGVKGDVQIPFACTITSVTLLADQSGSIAVDIWKDTYGNFPPTDADSITASAVPTITTATKSTDSTLTGWTKTITAGDILRFNVDNVTTITRFTLSLGYTRS
jgi:hypothetical protein